MKQTAVEWFFSELERMQYFIGNDMLEAYKEAKAMEKEQRFEDFKQGFHSAFESLEAANNSVQSKTFKSE